MNRIRPIFASLVLLIVPVLAFSIEPSNDVKVSTVLKTSSSWDGKPLVYPSGAAEVTGLLIEIAPGGHTIWHRHPVPSFALILEGELEVQLENGTLKRFKAGEALAEVVDTPHYGRNVGSGAVKLVVFYAGSAGQPLSYTEAEK
ncbi:MAG: cupin domain-containing protein [Sulfuricurvum sp.]